MLLRDGDTAPTAVYASASVNGMKSTTEPAARSPASSSNTANPSDCTIDDKIAEPSRGYFMATRPLPRSRLARRYSRRPGFLRWAKPVRTGNSFGGAGAALASFRISGLAIVTKVTKAATGLPGNPISRMVPIWPSAYGTAASSVSRLHTARVPVWQQLAMARSRPQRPERAAPLSARGPQQPSSTSRDGRNNCRSARPSRASIMTEDKLRYRH